MTDQEKIKMAQRLELQAKMVSQSLTNRLQQERIAARLREEAGQSRIFKIIGEAEEYPAQDITELVCRFPERRADIVFVGWK